MTNDIGIIELSGTLKHDDYRQFMAQAIDANRMGLLTEYIERYSAMLDEGCDPGNSMQWAYVDILRIDRGEEL